MRRTKTKIILRILNYPTHFHDHVTPNLGLTLQIQYYFSKWNTKGNASANNEDFVTGKKLGIMDLQSPSPPPPLRGRNWALWTSNRPPPPAPPLHQTHTTNPTNNNSNNPSSALLAVLDKLFNLLILFATFHCINPFEYA